MLRVDLSIRGLQEAQARNLARIAALKPNGALGRLVRDLTVRAHRYAVAATHVDTGALRASHRLDVQPLRGRIYVDPSAVNPRSKRRPAEYGVYEHHRGGSHAFYTVAREELTRELNGSLLHGLMMEVLG